MYADPLPARPGRRMPTVRAIHLHWTANERLRFAMKVFGQCDPGEPSCYACGWWPWSDLDTEWSCWERAHLVDRFYDGLDGVQNLILLCSNCHSGMPSFRSGNEHEAIAWVASHERWSERAKRLMAHNERQATVLEDLGCAPIITVDISLGRSTGRRTQEALAVKRSQGVRLGRPPVVPQPTIARIVELRERGASFNAVAQLLDTEQVPTPRGGDHWHAATVRRLYVSAMKS